jgi:hypothetical protein
MFHEQYPRWLWSRIGLARGSVLPDGTPVQIVRRRYGGRFRTSVNLLAEPADLTSTLAELLKFAVGRGRGLVINYPADWTPRMRAAARRLKVPKAKCFFVAWRVYGRRLRGSSKVKEIKPASDVSVLQSAPPPADRLTTRKYCPTL